jgi:hypothetical protein
MKKMILLLVVSMFVFSGCIMVRSPIMGYLVTNAEVSGPELNEPMLSADMVEGSSIAEGILGVVWGDCSYETALQDALKKSNAKSLKNIVVDNKIKYILGIYVQYVTIVRGVPVR